MSKLVLKLLGPPEVSRDGVPIRFRSRKELALLLYLATEGGMHAREKLVELFWPRSGESRGLANLRNALSSLRKTLAEEADAEEDDAETPYLKVERYYVYFNSTGDLDLDLSAVESAGSGTADPTAQVEGERDQVVTRLQDALEVHRGDFLEGFYLNDAPEFDHWADGQREAWRQRLGSIYDLLSGLQMESGELAAAAETANQWVKKNPTEEAAQKRLIEALSAAGDHRGALGAYESYRARLEKELGVGPGPEIEAAVARLRSESVSHQPTRPQRFRTAGEPVSLNVPLVGRSAEFGALVAEYRATREGGPRGVAIIGEAGIGKTRLANEFLLWAEAQGAEVLRARAFEGGDVPYGPMLGALRERVEQERAPDDLLDDRWLLELSRLLPEIRERYPDLSLPAGDPASAKSQLFEAVHQLIMAFVARTKPEPVVLFIDDLQWVDSATLELRQYEWRRWTQENAPVLIITSIREEALEFDPGVSRRLANAGRRMPLRRLSLEPLGPKDTMKLFGALTNGGSTTGETAGAGHEEITRWLYRETEGQPFFLMETLQTLLEEDILSPRLKPDGGYSFEVRATDSGALEGVMPAGVRESVRGRLSRLDTTATDLLAAGAVLGRGFSFELLFHIANLDEDEGLAALDKAISNRLLREAGSEENSISLAPSRDFYPMVEADYVFSHEKVREVVYTEAGEARRRILHRRALETLEEEGAPVAELMRHARGAGLPEKTFRYSLAAGDEAMALFAVEDAAGYYERARSLYEDPRTGQRVRQEDESSRGPYLYGRLGDCYKLFSRWTQTLEAYERMLAEARDIGDRETEWDALIRLAGLATDMTTQPEADDETFRGVRERTEQGVDDTAGGYEVGTSGRPERFEWSPSYALGRAEEALSLARELGREDLIAHSIGVLALLGVYAARWERVASESEEARARYAAMGDRAIEAEFLNLSAWGELMIGNPEKAIYFGKQKLAAIQELGDQAIHVADLHGLVAALLEVGEYEEALSVAHRGLAAARSLGSSERLHPNLLVSGDVCRTMFRLGEARTYYTEMSRSVNIPQFHASTNSKLCAVAALEGDWGEAYAFALEASALRGEIVLQFNDPFHRHHEVEALFRAGDADLASEVLKRFEEHTKGNRRIQAAYLRALAVADCCTDKKTAAIDHLKEAEKLAGEIGLPGELWQIRSTLGELYEERGNYDEAICCFSLAAQTIQTLAGKIENKELRSGFLDSEPIRRVLEKTQPL